MTGDDLRTEIERLASIERPDRTRAREVVLRLLDALESGSVRAAEPRGNEWIVHRWVKQGILLGFRVGDDRAQSLTPFHFRDRDTFPTRGPLETERVRIVPGGTTVRRGAHLGRGVVIMPPAYVNVGAWVGAGSMIDSHALVGSCAQVGREVHVSAAAQLGGVLEPVGALPVVVEDGAFVGGGCGLYEGVRVGRRAVLAPGVVLTRGVRLYDLVQRKIHGADANRPLTVPDAAVVVPGARRASGDFARQHGLRLQTPVIVKYREAGTDAALALEEALR